MIIVMAALMSGVIAGEAPAAPEPENVVSGVEVVGKKPTREELRRRRLDPNVIICKTETRTNGIAERVCQTRGAWNEKAKLTQSEHRDFMVRSSQLPWK
jgi:hypothetical protein